MPAPSTEKVDEFPHSGPSCLCKIFVVLMDANVTCCRKLQVYLFGQVFCDDSMDDAVTLWML